MLEEVNEFISVNCLEVYFVLIKCVGADQMPSVKSDLE